MGTIKMEALFLRSLAAPGKHSAIVKAVLYRTLLLLCSLPTFSSSSSVSARTDLLPSRMGVGGESLGTTSDCMQRSWATHCLNHCSGATHTWEIAVWLSLCTLGKQAVMAMLTLAQVSCALP